MSGKTVFAPILYQFETRFCSLFVLRNITVTVTRVGLFYIAEIHPVQEGFGEVRTVSTCLCSSGTNSVFNTVNIYGDIGFNWIRKEYM